MSPPWIKFYQLYHNTNNLSFIVFVEQDVCIKYAALKRQKRRKLGEKRADSRNYEGYFRLFGFYSPATIFKPSLMVSIGKIPNVKFL